MVCLRRNFVEDDKFEVVEDDPIQSLRNFLDYLFEVAIVRKTTDNEFALFKEFMYDSSNEKLKNQFNLLNSDPNAKYTAKQNISIIAFHYIAKLEELYMFKEVE